MQSFDFCNPTRVLFGLGKAADAGEEIVEIGERILLVTGKGSVRRSGVYDRVRASLDKAGAYVTDYEGIDPNPRIKDIREAAELCREEEIQVVVALGGGSVMDAAKVIAAAALYQGDAWDLIYHGQRPYNPPQEALSIVTIPTLAATGSEMNKGAVITRWDTHEKCYVASPCLYPRLAILDPELTYTVPANQTAYGVSDMICHVTEAYFNGAEDTPVQDRMVEGLILTAMENAEAAIAKGDDASARAALLWASTVALNGWAQSGLGGDYPVHLIEHAVSALYDVPHGGGLSILSPAWMRMTYSYRLPKFVQFATRIFGIAPEGKTEEEVALAGVEAFERFLAKIGCPLRLSELGVPSDKFDWMASEVIRLSGDSKGELGGIRPLTKDDIVEMFEMVA